jgi:hypothetical protein
MVNTVLQQLIKRLPLPSEISSELQSPVNPRNVQLTVLLRPARASGGVSGRDHIARIMSNVDEEIPDLLKLLDIHLEKLDFDIRK